MKPYVTGNSVSIPDTFFVYDKYLTVPVKLEGQFNIRSAVVEACGMCFHELCSAIGQNRPVSFQSNLVKHIVGLHCMGVSYHFQHGDIAVVVAVGI